MVEEDGDSTVVDGKHLQCILHAVKRCGLPHKVHREVGSDLRRNSNIGLQLQTNFFIEASYIINNILVLDTFKNDEYKTRNKKTECK